jgi:hypothetical protein
MAGDDLRVFFFINSSSSSVGKKTSINSLGVNDGFNRG